MAVDIGAFASATPATSNSISIGLTVSETNPVVLVGIALKSTTATVSGVTWSQGGGTPYEVKTVRLTDAFASVWAIPAPTAGTGTVGVTLSDSVAHQAGVQIFWNAKQTSNVCPTTDADSDSHTGTGSGTTNLTVTPLNLTSDDGSYGFGALTIAGDVSTVGTTVWTNTSTVVNAMMGYVLGSGPVVAAFSDFSGSLKVAIGVRVSAPGAADDQISVTDTATVSELLTIFKEGQAEPSISNTVTVSESVELVTVGSGSFTGRYYYQGGAYF